MSINLKDVVLTARVSREEQAKGDAVSIDEQLADMRKLCERNRWRIVAEYIDSEDYRATQNPNKGRIVNPSGERADRPQFLKMLEMVRTGKVDAILCWRDDRLVRHPRVAVVMEDALDTGDRDRSGKEKIQVLDATGAVIDRFSLHIKAAVWREENKRRAERIRMGKVGTLKEGRWPSRFDKFGYTTVKDPNRRGHRIVLGDPGEVRMIENIFDWYDKGIMVRSIRQLLITQGAKQKHLDKLRYDWSPVIISRILRDPSYKGKATWRYADGNEYTIDIPAIVPVELWERIQKKLDANKKLAVRNARGVYLCQNLVHCGHCKRKLTVYRLRFRYRRMADGTLKRYPIELPVHQYRCSAGQQFPEAHTRPYTWEGISFDWAIWRALVDRGIKTPHLIIEQVQARQLELQRQGEGVDSEIASAKASLIDVDNQRAVYQRQHARGKISEREFDARMAETEEAQGYWQEKLNGLKELRDNKAKIQSGLEYAEELMKSLQMELPDIDQPPEELRKLSVDERLTILARRQVIVRALCDRIDVYPDGKIKIDGLIDGSEGLQFGLQETCLR